MTDPNTLGWTILIALAIVSYFSTIYALAINSVINGWWAVLGFVGPILGLSIYLITL